VTKATDDSGTEREIPSWNIGGQTVVGLDALAELYADSYTWDQEARELRLLRKQDEPWSRDLSASEQGDELSRGFAVRATGFSADSETVTLKGEGNWDAVDDLKLSDTGVSFSLYQRVTEYDGCLNGLSEDVATFDPVRDNVIDNKQENTPERWSQLAKSFRVYVNGSLVTGELWRWQGNGHTDYTYHFDQSLRLEDVKEVYIVVGDAEWVADRAESYESESTSVEIGTVVDYALYTDIVAYLDGYPIPSYNVNGNTVVVAEDLEVYGFYVTWSQEERTLRISSGREDKEITASYKPEQMTGAIGSRAMPVLSTDIVTIVQRGSSYSTEKAIQSWNIGGQTVVSLDDLAAFYGSAVWDGTARTIKMTCRDYWWHMSANLGSISTSGSPLKLTIHDLNGEKTAEWSGNWNNLSEFSLSGYQLILNGRYYECPMTDILVSMSHDMRVDASEESSERREERAEKALENCHLTFTGPDGAFRVTGSWTFYPLNGGGTFQFDFDQPVDLSQVDEMTLVLGQEDAI
jgi:hypothetical protein